jgi:hypothetical protein
MSHPTIIFNKNFKIVDQRQLLIIANNDEHK